MSKPKVCHRSPWAGAWLAQGRSNLELLRPVVPELIFGRGSSPGYVIFDDARPNHLLGAMTSMRMFRSA